MKNTAKRILSIVLTCLVLLSVMPMAFNVVAAERPVVTGRGETYNHYPEVRVKGFGVHTRVDLGIVAYHFDVATGRTVSH